MAQKGIGELRVLSGTSGSCLLFAQRSQKTDAASGKGKRFRRSLFAWSSYVSQVQSFWNEFHPCLIFSPKYRIAEA